MSVGEKSYNIAKGGDREGFYMAHLCYIFESSAF